ncbi:MAG: sugar kinase [Clostridiales bacterium]|nr:sugar kinase [Clostridiales bacterium]
MNKARIALIGDLCLDVYWTADMTKSELSRETPHHPLPIVSERYSAGGAANVAANIKALNPKSLTVIGLTGCDWRGDMLRKILKAQEISCDSIIEDKDVVTNCYIKPMRHGISDVAYEDPRLDFENHKAISRKTEDRIINELEKVYLNVDVLCVSDQLTWGVITPRIREYILDFAKNGTKVIVDSRNNIGKFPGCIIKPNETEAMRAFGVKSSTVENFASLAREQARKNGTIAVITLGAKGSLISNGETVTLCKAKKVLPPIDFCGAGDTYLSAFAAAVASGAEMQIAAKFATLASAVTIKKLHTTGTASRDEIMKISG